jgi:NADPH2:quinone reductase
LDIMGASYLPRNINALAMDGRLFLLATQGGEIGEINLTSVIYRRLTVTGSFAPPTEPGFLVRFA